MMNYEMFKKTVAEQFKDYLSEQFKDAELRVEQMHKTNHTVDGIVLSGNNISLSICINDMYEQYQRCNDLHMTLQSAVQNMEAAMLEISDIGASTKDNIVFFLINTEQNKEMLHDIPHREFQDLSIIYKWIIRDDMEGIQSAIIKNSTAERLGLNEEQLFRLASENTKRLLPPVIKSMDEMIREIFGKDGIPMDMVEIMIGEIPLEMYIISNNKGINGAVSMLYEDGIHDLAEKLGSDLYIMPSSVHEVIAVSTDIGNPDELAAMVAEINMAEVSLDERLSNQVYHYDKDLRKLTLATDTPYKRLDEEIKTSEPNRTIHMGGQVR